MNGKLDRLTFSRHALVCVLTLPALARSESVAADTPFVAGFERFARHGEIAPATAGHLLLTELSCTSCHPAGRESRPKRGPVLDGIGNRVSQQWLKRFLAAPGTVAPGTTMPDMLNGMSQSAQRDTIAALVAFLGTKRRAFPEIKGTGARPVPLQFWKRGQPDRGRQLYHRIGCVACHEADDSWETVETKPSLQDRLLEQLDPDELAELGLSAAARRVASVPITDLAAKYSRQSLTYFLMDPHSIRPGGRMPDFMLSVDEAADLTAWLLPGGSGEFRASGDESSRDTSLVERGGQFFRSLGCANCHVMNGVEPTLSARPLAELDTDAARSCVATPTNGLPHYSLDDAQQRAITAGLKDDASPPADAVTPQERVQFQLLSLNCLACHERGELGGVGRYRRAFFETRGHVDIGDEGRLPPSLTSVGRKLEPGWITKVLQGTGAIRPHMRIRMPVFPADQVDQFPTLLALADATKPLTTRTEKEVFGDLTGLAEDGRQLLDTGCVQCHPLRTESLPGVVGVDLAGTAGRVQPQWFREFLLDPAALKPNTRMPTFFPRGKSQNPNVLDGDTDRQIAAMWAYLKDINRQELPAKIEIARSQDYELVPEDRPVLLRTFMEEAGTHAIAVGFPQRVHFAWDAEGLYPAFAWKGRFLDARGTWFERFTPPAKPLDPGGVFLPRGVSLATSGTDATWPVGAADDYRYLGHRLDKTGVPTFRYQLRDFLIEERLTPTGKGLARQLTITNQNNTGPETLRFLGHRGQALRTNGPQCRDETGLTVVVPRHLAAHGRVVRESEMSVWVLPITVDRQARFEVRYEW